MNLSAPLKQPARNLPMLVGIVPIAGSHIPLKIIKGITLATLAFWRPIDQRLASMRLDKALSGLLK